MATNKNTRDTLVTALVVIAVLFTVAINLLADKKFGRLDLTTEGRYRLSQPFTNILKRLDSTATVTYYVSGQVPGWFESDKRDILDKLNEMVIASNGKIVLEVIDPTENRELLQSLDKERFVHQVEDLKKEQFSLMRLVTGIKITYRDKPRQNLPAIRFADQLEYMIGSKIVELTLKKKPVIAVVAPQGAEQMPMMPPQRGQRQSGFEWLGMGQWDDEKKFDVKSIDLSEARSIPAETELLVVIRPKELHARQRYEIEKYLAGGGNLLLIASPFKIAHEFNWRADRTPTGLEDYLKEVGLTLPMKFVADNSNLRMPRNINLITGEVEYSRTPLFVRILSDNIDQESVFTRLMPGLLMPSPAQIDLDEAQLKKNGLNHRVLAKTSKQSWNVPFTETVDPDALAKYDEAKQEYTGSKNVFVILDGQFPFTYEGKPAPEWAQAGPPDPNAEKKPDGEKKPELGSVTKKPGKLIVCSSPEAFHAMYLSDKTIGQHMQGNGALIVNIAETFSLGDDLVKIRSKKYETRTIDKMTANDAKRNAIKAGLIAGVPVLVILFALIRTMLRRAAQVRYERKFAGTIGPSSFTS